MLLAMATVSKKREGPAGERAPKKRRDRLRVDPIIIVDATGTIQSANESVQRVFGWEPSALLGRDIRSIIHDSHTELLSRLLARGGKARRAATLASPQDLKGVRRSGDVVPIDLTMSATDMPGQPVPVFVVLIRAKQESVAGPISEQAERVRLLAVVAEQTKAIAAAQARLVQSDRMAAMGTLAAGLGHDMNNVLLPIRAHLNAIATKHCQPGGREHLLAIQRSIGYLQQLCDGLHHLTLNPEVDAGQPVANLGMWWKDAGRLLSDALPADVAVKVELDPMLPEVAIEPHRLTQIMLNLIVNAGEAFSEPWTGGGVPPVVKKVRIWARVDTAKEVVELAVTDNGPGMSPDVARRAFELFFTTKTRRLGSGLGMPLVQRLIAGVGGSVRVETRRKATSRSGAEGGSSGTTILLTLRTALRARREAEADGVDGADAISEPLRRRSAVVSVGDARVAAMVRLVLETAVNPEREGGFDQQRFEVVAGSEPRDADVWVTDSSAASLAVAQRWCAADASRRVLLAGATDPRRELKWKELGAVVIEDVSEYQEIRLGLMRALAV